MLLKFVDNKKEKMGELVCGVYVPYGESNKMETRKNATESLRVRPKSIRNSLCLSVCGRGRERERRERERE